MYPPTVLIQWTKAPEFRGKTWGEFAEYAQELKSWGLECNANMQGLEEWADGKSN